MKKLVLFVMVVLGFAGMSVAQDVYSSGYYLNQEGKKAAAVYKNSEKLYESVPEGTGYGFDNTDVDYYDGDVYWVRNRVEDNGTFRCGDVYVNGNLYLSNEFNGSHIYDLYRCPFDDALYSGGCMSVDGLRTATIWKGGNHVPFLQLGDGSCPSVAYCLTSSEDNLYSCGYLDEQGGPRGVIWKNSEVFLSLDQGTKLLGVAYYDGFLYTVGTDVIMDETCLRVWRTDVTDGITTPLYSSLSTNASAVPERTKIYIDAGDVYVVGVTQGFDRLYKNGQEVYNTPAYYTSVFVNSNGVYYAGGADDYGGYYYEQQGRIWKDGSLLYSPSDCQQVTSIFVEEECTNTEVRTLPFFEGFETGETDWTCWTAEDRDGQNYEHASYWHRGGKYTEIMQNDDGYCAWHSHERDHSQQGFLFSPVIRIPAGSNVKLTFQSYERNQLYYHNGWEAVWVKTSTAVGDGEIVWHPQYYEWSEEWKTIEIDLSAYQGQDIIIGFEYFGLDAHSWYIDDVRIEQVAAPVEYTITTDVDPVGTGRVTGGGTYPAGVTVTLTATANPGYIFSQWQDGNTDNPRPVTVTGNATYTATFEVSHNFTITVVSADPTMGSATGGGTFMEGTVINISARPLTGYYFIGWTDGNADNPRSITVTANETYVAQFGTNPVQTYTLTVMCNSSEGSTIGSGTYTAGSTTTIAAIPNSGYLFDKWQDNVTENPRQVIVNSDMTFVAFFKGTGVNENEGRLLVLYPNPANEYVRLEGIEADSEVRIYNAMGALVKVVNASANEEIGISELSDGLYLLRCGNVTLRFVKK